jgi:hypothetical protein
LWLKTGSLKAGLIAVEQLSRDLETLVGTFQFRQQAARASDALR